MSILEERDELVERIRNELRLVVHASRESQRQIEKRNGFSRGYLSQVLSGHITLTVRHVLGTLLALEISPEKFFAELFSTQQPLDPLTIKNLRERMERYDAAFAQLERRGLLESSEQNDTPKSEDGS